MNKKLAYPSDPWKNTQSVHNLEKWMSSFQEVLNLQPGIGRTAAVAQVTNDWEVTERDDFINWMRYYEGLNHLKYKKAQVMSENGYYIPQGDKPEVKADPGVIATMPGAKAPVPEAVPVDESSLSPGLIALDPKKEKLETHKKKLISRLDSLEKLLRNDISQEFVGAEISNFIRSIHDLKVNFYGLKLASMNTLNDLIYQKSNSLTAQGFVKSAGMLLRHAQLAPAPPTPDPTNVDNATPANNTQTGPLTPADESNPPVDLTAKPGVDATKKFLKNMGGGTFTDLDENLVDDESALELESEDDEITDLEDLESDDDGTEDEVLTVSAQAVSAPGISPAQPLPNPDSATPDTATPNASPEAAKPSIGDPVTEITQSTKDIDDMIEQAFGKVTPEMIITKLEEVSKIFKTKEIPRQLAIIDFMLDKLGMSTFFPQLSEASGKAIESSNYISSRIDDVLSHLRGVIKGNGIDLVNGEGDPKVEAIKDRLQAQQDAEANRKAQRAEESTKETPVMEIEQPAQAPEVNVPAPVTPVAPLANQ